MPVCFKHSPYDPSELSLLQEQRSMIIISTCMCTCYSEITSSKRVSTSNVSTSLGSKYRRCYCVRCWVVVCSVYSTKFSILIFFKSKSPASNATDRHNLCLCLWLRDIWSPSTTLTLFLVYQKIFGKFFRCPFAFTQIPSTIQRKKVCELAPNHAQGTAIQ